MSQQKKPRYDRRSPEARALIDEIVHGTFVKEGTMVAFPTCFPGASTPIPADESHITALDISPDGMIYGGTSGRATHLFVAMFHGVTGAVLDRGTVEGARHCAAVCCGQKRFAACVNGPAGGRVVTGALQPLPFDLIQEWGFSRTPFQDLGEVDGEPIVHAVTGDSKSSVVGITTRHLFTVALQDGKIEVAGEVPGNGRIGVGSKGGIFGRDGPGHLWRYDQGSRQIQRQAVPLPKGAWDQASLSWARDRRSGALYTADANGNLFSFDEQRGFSGPLGRATPAPIGPWAATHDGRLFGFCGSEMANLFCYHPGRGQVTNLGVAVSVLERRRYGYVFGDAVTGRDGQIIFGEDDDLGHLWIYFPSIVSAPAPPYPHSPVIRDIAWHWETYTTAAPGSDLWPFAWGPDDNLYAAWGDGGGFGGSDSDGRVAMGFARIEGGPEHWHGVNVNGGKNPEHPASFPKKGKTAGVAFVDGVLYALINLQDGTWPDVNHALGWSTDKGATWTKAKWVFPTGAGNFQPAIFVTFGKDYTGAPARLAGYAYLCGPKHSAGQEGDNRLYLARAPRDKLPERAAYQFFQGIDAAGTPVWVAQSALAAPVFTDPNGVAPGSLVYVPGLNRFLLTCFHVGPGQLGVFDAPNPWGPWTTIAYYEDWGGMGAEGEGLTCGFPQKWMSADGLTLWSIFSAYGDGAKKGINAHDRFNLVRAALQRL